MKKFIVLIRVLQIFLILFTCSFAFSQPGSSLYFDRINTENGLSHDKVNCIIQDRRGFIWFGTDDGLNRYDGQNFTVFRHDPADEATLSGNIITGLIEDENEILWITTADGGLTKYNYRLPAKEQFRQYKHIPGDSTTIPVNTLNAIIQDKRGYLWLGTSGAYVLRFDKKKERFEKPQQKGTSTILALCLDGDGNIWAGRHGGGFLKINTSTFTSEMDERYTNYYARLPHVTVTSIIKDRENNIWFGSWDKVLYRYNHITRKEEKFEYNNSPYSFPNDEALSFAIDNNDQIWIGGRYNGLTVYNSRQNKFFNYRYNQALRGSIADNQVNCVFIDDAGMVWIGTNKGISNYNPSQKPFVQTFLPKQKRNVTIYDFYEDEAKSLWMGTNEGIFFLKAGEDNFQLRKIIYKGEELAVSKFFKDEDGSFYLGTNYSFFRYDALKNTVTLLPGTESDVVISKIINSRVTSVVRDTIGQHPVLVVAPYGHFFCYYDLVEKKWISRADSVKNIIKNYGLKDNLISKFFKTKDGLLWLTNGKAGLGSWHEQPLPGVTYYNNNPRVPTSISSNHVSDITEDNENNLWVSTYGGGLNYFNRTTRQFAHINTSNNLLEGIETDAKGKVWMISNGQVNKYDPLNRSYRVFTLPDLENSGGVKGEIYKDCEGNMYVAGINYFIRFNPEQVKEITEPPKIFFTDFKIFDNSFSHLLFEKNIQLRYFENSFTIDFSAPVFAYNNTEYTYLLEGVDQQWRDVGSRNFASYSHIRPGTYTFKVRATVQKVKWGTDMRSLTIIIAPPFWQRWWFSALCAIAIAATLHGIYRYRINELTKRQMIRNKIAQDLHDSLGSTLSSISIYSQVARIYQEQQKSVPLQQTLEKIGSTSNEMIAEMSDIVWAINPKNDSMSRIIQRMESFARPVLQAKNIHLTFQYDPSVTELLLSMEKRKSFYLIFKEAVNNALKYSDCRRLDVNIEHHHHKVQMTIRDDGVGFDAKTIDTTSSTSLSGNGLKNMQMRAEEIGATFQLQSQPGEGTTIHLAFSIP